MVNGFMPQTLEETFNCLIQELANDRRSASEIARLAGVSQPTVSRLRLSRGTRFRASESFINLCIFYNIPIDGLGRVCDGYNEALCDAIVDVWDGSKSHAQALLVVIRSLKGLTRGQMGAAGGSNSNAKTSN